jgi:hypothetical protein
MSLWSINQLADYVRGQAARGRRRFGFIAENGDTFRVDDAPDGNGVVVLQDNGAFGCVLCDHDPFEEYGAGDSWDYGHDPGDEHTF